MARTTPPSNEESALAVARGARQIQLASAAAVLGVWEIVTRSGLVPPIVLPSFTASVAAMGDLLADPSFRGSCLVTLRRVAAGFAIAAPLGISIGLLLARRGRIREFGAPLLHFLLAVPQSIFIPLFILVLGLGDMQKIAFAVTHTAVIVAVATYGAARTVPPGYAVAARSFGASDMQIFLRVVLPAIVPALLTGLRAGLILAVASVLFAEMYASRDGVGMLIIQWTEALHTGRAMAAVLLVSLTTIAVNESCRGYERRIGHWQLGTATR